MNKLLVSDNIKINDGSYDLDIKNNSINIIINGKVTLYLINQLLDKINIELEDNSELCIYKYNKYKENNLKISINQNNNTKLIYNEAIINNLDNKLIINNNINGNNNKSEINIRNISENNNSEIVINVDVKKNTIGNIALEDLKGINNGGHVHIEPNIICSSNEVEANHLTTIGSIDEDLINYLNSKGISIDTAKELLLKGFIYSKMDDYIINN